MFSFCLVKASWCFSRVVFSPFIVAANVFATKPQPRNTKLVANDKKTEACEKALFSRNLSVFVIDAVQSSKDWHGFVVALVKNSEKGVRCQKKTIASTSKTSANA